MTEERKTHAEFVQTSPTQYRIEVTIPADTFRRRLDEVYSELSKKAIIPGFRPGHAPRNILNRFFGRDKILDEVMDDVIEDTIWSPIREREFTLVGAPRVTSRDWREDGGFVYSALIDVLPDVPPVNYSDIRIVLPVREVTEKDIEDELFRIKVTTGKMTPAAERPAREGDLVEVEIEAKVPDVMVPSLEGEEAWGFKERPSFILGRDDVLPGLDAALSGMELEEIREFELDLPSDHPDYRVRGKRLQVKARLISISEIEPQELTEEFIKEKFGTSGVTNLDQLREHLRKGLESANAERDRRETLEQIESFIHRIFNFPLPFLLVRHHFVKIMDRVLGELHDRGHDVEKLMEEGNARGLEIRKRVWYQAERAARMSIVISETARREGIKVSEEDLVNYLMLMAYRLGLKEKDIRNLLQDENLINDTREDLLRRQVMNFIASKVSSEKVPSEKFREFADREARESRERLREWMDSAEDPLAIIQREGQNRSGQSDAEPESQSSHMQEDTERHSEAEPTPDS